MSDFFYCCAFAFIIMDIYEILRKKVALQGRNEAEQMFKDSVQQATLDVVINYAKNKGIKAVIGFFYMAWQIVGICSTPERKYFMIHLIMSWVFAYAPFFTDDNKKKYEMDVVGTVVGIFIVIWILYSHFYLT